MKKILWFLCFLNIVGFANDRNEDVKEKLIKLANYTCFQEYFIIEQTPGLPWEITHLELSRPYMIIRQTDQGILFAQPLPECPDHKEECGYWIRSSTWKNIFIFPKINVISCPKYLTKRIVDDLVKKYHSKEYKI